MQMLSDDDVAIKTLSPEELDAAWDLWLDLAQSTNDADPPYTHGVFTGRSPTRSPVVACADPPPLGSERLGHEERICAALLARVMASLSEDYWCAGWLTDLEFQLWEAAVQGSSPSTYPAADLEQLRDLSTRCGGWVTWIDWPPWRRYVPLDEWRKQYAAWAARRHGHDREGGRSGQ